MRRMIMNGITEESMEMLLEEIVDAVESIDDRDVQFDMVSAILIGNGIVEIIEEDNEDDEE